MVVGVVQLNHSISSRLVTLEVGVLVLVSVVVVSRASAAIVSEYLVSK